MAGIHHHRQVAQPLHRQHGGQVEGIAGVGLVGADAPLAQDHVGVAAGHDVLRAHQPLLDGGGQAALEQDRLAGLAQQAQQVEVLHVAGAHLDAVHLLVENFDIVGAHDFRDDGQSGSSPGFLQQGEALVFQPLEGVGRGAGLERAAPQHRCAGLLDLLGHVGDLLLALHGAGARHHGQLLAAHLGIAYLHRGGFRVEHAVGLLEGLGHLHDALHAAEGLNLGGIHLAGIADEAQNGQVGAEHGVHVQALGGEHVGQPVDFLLLRTLLQNNNHVYILLLSLPMDTKNGDP